MSLYLALFSYYIYSISMSGFGKTFFGETFSDNLISGILVEYKIRKAAFRHPLGHTELDFMNPPSLCDGPYMVL